MGCCLGCFRTEENNNENEVNRSDIGLSKKSGQETVVQDTCTNIKTQEKTEQGKGKVLTCRVCDY